MGDGWTNGLTDKRTNKQINRWRDNKQLSRWPDKQRDGGMKADRQTKEQMDKQTTH